MSFRCPDGHAIQFSWKDEVDPECGECALKMAKQVIEWSMKRNNKLIKKNIKLKSILYALHRDADGQCRGCGELDRHPEECSVYKMINVSP